MIRLGRRAFLGGAGALVALPAFESLAQTAPPMRFVAVFAPNGINMSGWTPDAEGPQWQPKRLLLPLAPVKPHVTVITGLSNAPAASPLPGDHARGTGSFLTCEAVVKSEAADITNGTSVDQLMVQRLNPATRFRSLQLGLEGGESQGSCDNGYSCAYTRNISWAGPKSPMPKLVEPRVVFERLFAGADASASQQQLQRRRVTRASVLDYVRGEATSLSSRLSTRDRAKLDEYLTGVRELEVRLGVEAGTCSATAPVEGDIPVKSKQMIDLIVTALRCDLTRVVSFMLANGISNRSYDFLGARGAHHELSHHQNDPEKLEKLDVIATWEVAQFGYLLEALKAVPEGNGTLLDHTVAYFSSDVEDGNSHAHTNLPVLVAGRGGSVAGQHVRLAQAEPLANLYLAFMGAMGAGVDRFGDSTRVLPGVWS